MSDDPRVAPARGTFAGSVAGVLATRVAQLVATLAVSFLLALLLGPGGRGVYAVLVLLPTTLFAFGQLGLTSATTFHAGRGGRLADLERHSIVLGLAVSGVIVAATLIALPTLERSVLRTAPDDLLRIALIALPLRLVATLAGNVLYGLQRFRIYNLILAAQSVLSVVLVLVAVGWLGLGVPGALGAYLLFLAAGTVAVLLELERVRRERRRGEEAGQRGKRVQAPPEADVPVGARDLLRFGLRLYPSTVATFLGYRIDVYILGWLIGSATEIGIYSVAVSLAELVFNVPDSVGTVLFPRVASAAREEADRLAPAMTRMTILVTALASIALAPAAWVGLAVFLPEFARGIVPLVVILPGIVSLSVAKVLTSYLSGIERLSAVTWASLVSLVANVAINLVLIPRWGIVGAAASSLISYTAYAAMMVVAASRAANVPALSFVLPTRADAGRLGTALTRLVGRAKPTPADT